MHKVKSFFIFVEDHEIATRFTKFMKFSAKIRYIKTFKKEQLIPTFVRVYVSLKDVSFMLRKKIATLIMEAEMQNKHSEKRKLGREIRKIRTTLKRVNLK